MPSALDPLPGTTSPRLPSGSAPPRLLADFDALLGADQAALRGESLLRTHPGNPVSRLSLRLAGVVAREASEARALVGRT